MFDEDGTLDPLLKFLLYAVITLAVGKMLWEWLAEDVGQRITGDLWGLIADQLPVLLLLVRILSFLFGANTYADADDMFVAPSGDAIEADVLTFKMKQLSSMSATGFEQACTDLLARDGFRRPRRVGGAGDLGVDITARDDEDRLLIVLCKQYQSPVGSGHLQEFNGTARPHHGADLPIMIALNGFTQPAIDFAQHHQLILMGRPELKRWAHGEYLYDVLGIQSTAQ
ncbi:restriction endonuclease [Streptomyces sp. NBC_00016]|uniref:restriction endonuclease n=1 Tax=Streptomyces sp. NBC_00016 TaxID=2975622 RepID=UPI003246B825